MIVVDTSAWVEYLRATGSPTDRAVTAEVAIQRDLGIPDVVRMELLAGARSEGDLSDLHRFIARFPPLPSSSPTDHDLAAKLHRDARALGQTARSLNDCLIAAVALRLEAPLLARDRDFQVLASVSALQLV